LAFLAASPILVCLALFSGRLVQEFMKPDWAAAGAVLSLLAIAGAFAILAFLLDPVFVCTGRAQTQFLVRTGFALVLLVGVAVLAPFGPVAVAAWHITASCLLAVTAICLRGSLHAPVRNVFASLLYGEFAPW
jgi:O-antigen/teichoic acid export membrane protein